MQAEACVAALQRCGWGSSRDIALVLSWSPQVRDYMFAQFTVRLLARRQQQVHNLSSLPLLHSR